ncbi:family 1 glycosylhydrolase [Sphingomonas floccifaciens]|uniref:dTDP-4-dehydrorhamnose reductase n=2 Tax=Sphingomonas floccifaciens TaxID=1844115 RepID=A0ABW4N999_9SPHN
MARLERWCGAEATAARLGDARVDQLRLTGHHDRIDDLDRMAALGFTAVRFPILWERVVQPDGRHDWTWTDSRLARMRRLGLRPIAGLVHHGSGPDDTSLIADDFAPRLADFARAVAERYPWIADWTPVNEPVTTARFSALYGYWYPHLRDEGAFWRALVNQIDGVAQAMTAIREVIPHARLIQTEDMGRTWATAPLADQAAFDNQRRWAGFDLLFGHVTPGHPLWHRLCAAGLGEALARLSDKPCPPDIIGLHCYATSDRFLDHRIERFAEQDRGGNGVRAYADVPAVRALDPAPPPFATALADAWARYATPLALTEVHLGCTREEQMRWVRAAWDAATAARASGIDVRAVTAWALFGCHGWDTLLTRPGRYEPGAFDVATGIPRATGVARQWASLDKRDAVEGTGWWQRPDRFAVPAAARPAGVDAWCPATWPARPLLICGATGTLGRALARACTARGLPHRLTGRDTIDLGDADAIARGLDTIEPWAVIDATGWVRVDDAEDARDACFAANYTNATALARACATRGLPSVHVSSDLVFDGAKDGPYVEDDVPNPLGVYGASKRAMEDACLEQAHRPLIIRTAAFFSPHDRHNFAVQTVAALARGERFAAADDLFVSPSYVPALTDAMLDLLIDAETGIRHLAGDRVVSWAEFARRIAAACGFDPGAISGVSAAALSFRARRPARSGLASTHVGSLGALDASIADFATTASGHLVEGNLLNPVKVLT